MIVWTVEDVANHEGRSLVSVHSTKELATQAAKELLNPGNYIDYVRVCEVELDGKKIAAWDTQDGENWERGNIE